MNISEYLNNKKDKLFNYWEQLDNISKATKEFCKAEGIDYTPSVRARASKIINEAKSTENTVETETNQYGDAKTELSALRNDGTMMTIEEYCQYYDIPLDHVKSYKLVTHTGKGAYYNIASNTMEIADSIDFESIISKCFENKEVLEKKPVNHDQDVVDRLVWSDVHVGMEASRKGLALYAAEWNEDELIKSVKNMADFVISKKQSNILYIDELGDYLDGWNGETTRQGHKLPQNMNNSEAFDAGLRAKMLLIDMLSSEYESIICNNICEDNHSGHYGYVLNSAFKNIVDYKFDNVEVYNHNKFINHYFIMDRAIVITHGKDSRNLKFGFKPQLDPKQIEKIDQYLKINGVYKNSRYISFCKGDSHQCLIDMCSSDDFDYVNYMAFSPSSEWVQTNFKKGRRGFMMEHIKDSGKEVIYEPYFYD